MRKQTGATGNGGLATTNGSSKARAPRTPQKKRVAKFDDEEVIPTMEDTATKKRKRAPKAKEPISIKSEDVNDSTYASQATSSPAARSSTDPAEDDENLTPTKKYKTLIDELDGDAGFTFEGGSDEYADAEEV